MPVVYRQPADRPHLPLFAGRRGDLPDVAVGLIGIVQQLVVVQIVDLHRPPELLEIPRCADHPLGRFGQLPCTKAAVLQIADPDGHVEAFADQFDVAVVQNHVHGDVGIFQQEFPKDRRQEVHPEIGGHRHPQKARGGRLHAGYQRVGLTRVVQNAAGAVIVGKADLGRADPPRCPVEKPRAKPGLKRRYVLGHGRF